MRPEFVWVEKYRPTTIKDVILPDRIKSIFEGFVKKGDLPNMVLYGSPGTGKTSIVKAAIHELGSHLLFISGSLAGDINTMRNDVSRYAATMSLNGKRKYVLFDEADGLTFQAQQGFRSLIEEFSANCGFILTCNYLERIIDAISQSRMSHIPFIFDKKERGQLSIQFFKRVKDILALENIKYDEKVIVRVINEYFPDWRRTLGELQLHSSTGEINSGILSSLGNVDLLPLIEMMKSKKFKDVRQWAEDNAVDPQRVFNSFWREGEKYFTPAYYAQMIVTVGEYQVNSRFVSNQAINLAAMLALIMADAEYK